MLLMDIHEQHLDEATFLWSQWERALVGPGHDLEDTATLEERLLAHLDGLVIGGAPVAQELLRPALESEEPQRLSSALWVLLTTPGLLEPAELVSRLASAPPEGLAPFQRALELSPGPHPAEVLRLLLREAEPRLLALALEVLAFRGELPRPMALEWLQHPDARVAAAALQGALPLPEEVLRGVLPRLLRDERPGVQRAALEAGWVSGARVALTACREWVEAGTGPLRLARVLLALAGSEKDWERLLAQTAVKEARADVLWALGFSGRVEAAELCLEHMADKPVAALAGEAFSAITGLRLEEPYLAPMEEAEESLPPLEEDLERSLEPRPEDDLPVPQRQAVAAWWSGARKDFSRGTRYLRGQSFSVDLLLRELEQGPMRRRHMHALEFAARSQGMSMLPIRAFTRRQRPALEAARAARARLSSSSLSRLFGE